MHGTFDAKIINFNETRGPDPGFRHRWLDRLQDDPERRQSTFSVAYALARRIDPKKAAPEVWPGIELIAATAQVSISTAKTELKWLHDRGWLAFGKRRPKYVVRVLTMPSLTVTNRHDATAITAVVADPPATVVADPPATITTTRTSPPTKAAHSRREADASDARALNQWVDQAKVDRSPRMFRQSKVEAAIAFGELQKLDGWCGTWGDDEMNRWHALLRKGYAADDIVMFAAAFLNETDWNDVPSLGDFLACCEIHLEELTEEATDIDEGKGPTNVEPAASIIPDKPVPAAAQPVKEVEPDRAAVMATARAQARMDASRDWLLARSAS
jgi:hypothetical protein